MAQTYITDFSEYTTNQQPSDWTKQYAETKNWTVREEVGVLGGKYLEIETPGSTGSTGLSWDAINADADRANVEVLYRVRYANVGVNSQTFSFYRGSGDLSTLTGYRNGFGRGALEPLVNRVDVYVNGSFTTLADAPGTVESNVWYWVRSRVSGNTHTVKSWAGEIWEEPSEVNLTHNNSQVTAAGWVGLLQFSAGMAHVDYFSVATGGLTAPGPSLGGAAIATFDSPHLYIHPQGSKGPLLSLNQRQSSQITLDIKTYEISPTHSIYRSVAGGGHPFTSGDMIATDVDPSQPFVDNGVVAGSGYQYKVIANNTNNLVRLASGFVWADLEAAIASVDPAEGKVIIIPPGLHLMTASLRLIHNNTHVICNEGTEFRSNGSHGIIRNNPLGETQDTNLFGTWGSDCSWTGGYVTAGTQLPTDPFTPVALSIGRGWVLKDIHFEDALLDHHMEFNGVQDVKIINCNVIGLYATGGPYSNEIGKEMIQIEPSDNAGGPAYTGPHIQSKNFLIEGCTFDNSKYPSLPNPLAAIGDHNSNAAGPTENIKVRHCHFKDIYCGVDPYLFVDTLVEYCTFHNVDKPVNPSSGTNTEFILYKNTITYD